MLRYPFPALCLVYHTCAVMPHEELIYGDIPSCANSATSRSSATTASQRHGGPIQGPLETPRTSQHYSTKGFNRGPQSSTHHTDRLSLSRNPGKNPQSPRIILDPWLLLLLAQCTAKCCTNSATPYCH